MNKITVRKAEVVELVEASFPDYKGRKFAIEISESVYVDRAWGGGSREEIVALTNPSGTFWETHYPMVDVMQAPCGNLPLKPGAVYVVHQIFCGRDMGLTFHVHPQSPYLPRSRYGRQRMLRELSRAADEDAFDELYG